jgi:hypothetical protein
MTNASENLAERYGGTWGEHPDYRAASWRLEVWEEATRLGYWEWVVAQLEVRDDAGP